MSPSERFLLINERNISGKEMWSKDDGKKAKWKMRKEAKKGFDMRERRNAVKAMLQENTIWRNFVQEHGTSQAVAKIT